MSLWTSDTYSILPLPMLLEQDRLVVIVKSSVIEINCVRRHVNIKHRHCNIPASALTSELVDDDADGCSFALSSNKGGVFICSQSSGIMDAWLVERDKEKLRETIAFLSSKLGGI